MFKILSIKLNIRKDIAKVIKFGDFEVDICS